MRYLTFLFVLCVTTAKGQQTTLSFKVKDSLKRQIVFFEPIDGHANRAIPTHTIENDNPEDKTFTRIIKIEKPVAIEVFFGYEPLWLYLEPDQNILIDINLDVYNNKSTNGGLNISGPNSEGNEYFNDFNFQPAAKFNFTDNILLSTDLSSPLNVLNAFKQNIDSSFTYLKTLKSKKLITPRFYNLITNDLGLSYLNEFGKGLLRSAISHTSKIQIIDSLYEIYKPENEENLQGFFYSAYYYQHGIYKNTFSANSNLLPEDTIIRINNLEYKIDKDFIPFLYTKGEILEFTWGMALYKYKSFFPERFHEKDLTPYLSKFPDSWLKDLHLTNQKSTAVTKQNLSVDSSMIILLNVDTINSFQNIFEVFFKNKVVYVDFWATWCLPCKQEFSFNSAIDSFLLENKIERLYISFDAPGNHNDVLKNIYSFKLYGNHLLINKTLFEDIMELIYDGSSNYAIPRYLIINKRNQIVENNAMRPSSGNALLKQLELYMN